MESSKHGWRLLSTETVYDNPWIRVEDHAVINPSGKTSQYGKICFKNIAVAILAVDSHRQIYLVGQYRYTLDEYSWELPMGGAPLEENPMKAAQRELREETGVTAARWREIMRMHLSNSVTDEKGIVYLATELTAGEPQPEETENLEIRKLSLGEALTWAQEGRITDAMSVAGILRLGTDGDSLLA